MWFFQGEALMQIFFDISGVSLILTIIIQYQRETHI